MKKKIFRMTAVFLCLVILLQTLPLAVFAVETGAEAPAAAESSEQSLAPTASIPSEGTSEPTVLGEVEEMREPNQKTFRMSDGTYRRAIYPYDVHYEGDSGALLDIDNSLTSGTDGGEDVLANGANSSTVRFFKKSSGEKFYSLENGKNKVTVSIAGAAKADAVFENTPDGSGNPMALTDLSGSVRYEEIFPDVDVEYILVSKRVKENVIIKERGALSSLTYTYSFNGGVTAVQENDRKIAVYEKGSQTLLFTVTAPALWDSQGGYSDALTLTLAEAKNSKITLRLDFTVGEEMTYPVTVDPVLQFQAERNDIQDTHIIASNPTANYNANNHIRIRNDGYALLQFPTPSLRPGDKIIGAQIALFPYGYFDSNPGYSNTNSYNPTLKLTAHRITRAWNEKTVTYQSADPANGFYDPIAEDYFPVVSNDSFYSWDITRLANEWTEGTKTNHGILLKYAAPPSDGSTFDTFFCSTNGAYLQQAVWPQIVYSYINTVGVEDYFSYHTQSLGFSGEGYVNDLTGNLTVARELVTTGGTLAPVSLSLIYNTANALSADSAPYGTGWKLNLAQKIVKLTPPGSSAEYLQYTDADGTHHYFKTDSAGVWVDEIDPDRKLYLNSSNNDMEMKDSGDTTLYFTNRAGFDEWYLYKIVDIYGNYVNVNLDSSNLNRVNSAVSSDGNGVYMDYSDYGFLTAVRYMNMGAVKTVSVQYNSRMTTHNNGVTDIVFPDGSSARYNYHEGTYRLSSALNLDNSSIQYGYHNTSGRVASVREVSSAGTVGNQFTFAYEPTATTVTDVNLGRTYLYTFAANGTLKSAVDTTASDGNGYGQYYEWGGGNTSLTGMGNLTFASKTQKNTVNLLPNHSFEQSGSVAGVSYGTDSGSYDFTSEMARVGSRSYKLTAPVSGNYDAIYGYYVLSLPAAEEYTLSAYINTKDLESSSTGGARVVAIVGSEYYYSEVIKEAKDEWQRLSVTFPVTVGQNVSLCVSLSGTKGSIFFDNMQLEVGGLSDYNLLENAGFETDSAWSSYSPAPYTTAHKASGARAAQITSTPDTAYDFLQTLSVPNGKAGDSYVASAFAKATSVPAEGWRFTLLVRFTKSGATVNEQNILFNSHTTAWQKVAGAAKAT
ncbi:MAG: DNRLRE domain-containing protein, partial [Ruminococcaceae bacterium]|nr:DNRLRE domain-containing protein [Oscillospiraceae bacterium]